MNPSTTARATSSRLPTRARTTGSTNRAPPIPPCWISFRIPLTPYRLPPTAYHLPPTAYRLHPRSRHRHRFEQLVHERVARDPFRLRVEVREHAVPQHRVRQRPHVLEADVVAAVGERARLAAENQVLRGAHAGAERRPLLDRVGRGRRLRPAGADDVERVAHHRVRRRPAPHHLLERDDLRPAPAPPAR